MTVVPSGGPPAIAALPFDNRSGAPEQEYLIKRHQRDPAAAPGSLPNVGPDHDRQEILSNIV